MSSNNKIKGQVIFRAGAEIKDHNGTLFKLPAQRRANAKDFAQERQDRKERMRKLREGNVPQ